jgi:MFS family permease
MDIKITTSGGDPIAPFPIVTADLGIDPVTGGTRAFPTIGSLLLFCVQGQGDAAAMQIIIFRVVQGIGGAFLFSNSTAIIIDVFKRGERGLALGINQVAGLSGGFIGLVIGGLLSPISWRAVFLVSVPFGIIGTVWAYFMLKETAPLHPHRRIDYLGNILLYLGVGIMANVWWLATLAFVFFFWQYSLLASLEEEHLLKSFGEGYIRYCEVVPRFIPTFTKYIGGNLAQPPLDWRQGLVSEKRTLQAIGLTIVLLLALWQIRMEG